MADSKQSNLNGAYYGPSIPPPSHPRASRRTSGCCCCLLSLLWKIVLAVAVLLGIALLVIWILLKPNHIKFHVTDASLTQFNLTPISTAANSGTTAHTLFYDLSVNMTIRNPNRKIGVYYDVIEARAFYEDQRFSSVNVTRFYQGRKSTNYMNPIFKGQSLVMLEGSDLSKYGSETGLGVYNIDVNFYYNVRFRVGDFISGHFNPRVSCELKVPLINSTSVTTFKTTRCDFDLW